MALPALWAIRNAFPNACLTLLTNIDLRNPHYVSPRDVLPEKGIIDEWIAYPAKAVAFFRLSLELRRRHFDAVIYLMPRIRSSKQIDRDMRFFRFSGISKVIGAEYLRSNSLEQEIPKPTPVVQSESDFLLRLLSSEGIHGDGAKTELLLDDAEISSAKNWFRATVNTAHKGRKLIAIAPGSKWKSKIWSEMRFADVVRRLIAKNNCYPVIFGDDEDREKGERLLAGWKTGANAAGVLKIRESAALLRDCSLYLGNDTGTMHLAAAVGTPCVAIFAAIDWRGRWAPFGSRNQIFRKTVECEGCHTPDCFNQNRCLDLVTANEVYEACERVICQKEKPNAARQGFDLTV